MKILLDECVTKRLKSYLPGSVFTVTEMHWNGLVNGKLMAKCIENDFDILLTIDKNILYQQSVDKYDIIVVVFDAPDSKINTLIQFIERFNERLSLFEKRNLYVIGK
jgi:predicted nuclease of predicted toxin-antitoxin system